ncbi:MAG TPA: UDP-N-acetylglucosamine 2-epimerase (non-hydrolyzing) [Dehalococcoidia bacterium]|nr:UDP-N-acetylglucosamine 2-epimerase (non-hydrolyzing) [Dehalococcoidia bacterium]
MNILTVVGARPQFAKAAVVSNLLRDHSHSEFLVHTGQHYDDLMSDVFFRDLGLPAPDVNLGVGSASQGVQTAHMLEGLEPVLQERKPDLVMVYGDTNSTLAGALAAAKLEVPVAHVEAGFRSYNRSMPEEINRVLTDHLATYLFCPTENSVACLKREGIERGVHLVGDVMYDSLLAALPRAQERATSLLATRGVESGAYYLATVHRPANTDDPTRLRNLIATLGKLDAPVLMPTHPRTRAAMAAAGITAGGNLRLEEPVGYLEMLALEANARAVLTDSGGVQREAYFLCVPCVTLREESEWPELLATGWNVLAGCNPDMIAEAAQRPRPSTPPPPVFGDGRAGAKIVEILERDPPHR